MKFQLWLRAARPRTLFLAFACIWGGLLCAQQVGQLNVPVTLLTFLTALLLQVLSNFANDFGDSKHGADHAGRKGPKRTVQDGSIPAAQMKRAIVVTAVLALLCGILLLLSARTIIGDTAMIALFVTGVLSIVAAVTYTNGKRPYGYAGLGDLSVLLFFGFVSVMGTCYLQTAAVPESAWWLSMAYGMMSAGVLNLNNMRDVESDRVAGKHSIPVRLGPALSIIYHLLILLTALVCFGVWLFERNASMVSLSVLAAVLGINAGLALKARQTGNFDPLLKILSMSTLLLSILLQFNL